MVSSEGGKTYHLSLSSTDRRYLTIQAMVKYLKPVSASGLINTSDSHWNISYVMLLTGTDICSQMQHIRLSHAVLLNLDFADENKFQRPHTDRHNCSWSNQIYVDKHDSK